MHLNIENNKINKVVDTALKDLNTMIDVNMAIGTPIKTDDGDLILPISKVTLATLSGGGEYGKTGLFKKDDLPFSAGNGSIISLKPSAFLIKEGKNYKLMALDDSPYDKIIEKATDIFNNLTSVNYGVKKV